MTQQLILIRPKEQSKALLRVFQGKLGHAPNAIISPLMEIEALDVVLPENMQTPFIFTSQNAVRIAAQMFTQRGPVICVGAKVAQMAREVGFDVQMTYQTADDLLGEGVQTGTYLRAEQVSVELNKRGQLDEYIIYRQAPLPISASVEDAIRTGAIVPVYSEFAANRLLDCTNGNVSNTTVISISAKVTAVLTRGNFAQIYTAPAPTSDAMLTLILEHL
jgi:uroporphyrinogen-III synthase